MTSTNLIYLTIFIWSVTGAVVAYVAPKTGMVVAITKQDGSFGWWLFWRGPIVWLVALYAELGP